MLFRWLYKHPFAYYSTFISSITCFRHLLGLVVNPNRDRNILSNADLCKNELDKLDFIYHSRLDQFELKSNILNICLCYWLDIVLFDS